MAELLGKRQTQELAFLELSALRLADVLPQSFERARIARAGTVIFDLTGVPLFRRLPLAKGRGKVGYADIAVNPVMGEALLGVTSGVNWNQAELREAAQAAARRHRWRFDTIRFVAYSFPKIAAQFLLRGREVGMLELFSWQPVPEQPQERELTEPGNFERWSYVEAAGRSGAARAGRLEERIGLWRETFTPRRLGAIDMARIDRTALSRYVELRPLWETRKLHYTTRDADHSPCFEVRGQETSVWCVGASSQMFLEFWRYEYSQTRIANELGLGTKANPNGLPYNRVGDVPIALEALSSKAMDVVMHTNPSWSLFRGEIRANRPLISFVPGHSRAVAGYYSGLLSMAGMPPFRGLLVYDPWPPNSGAITQWENFDLQTYQYAYTAKLPLV